MSRPGCFIAIIAVSCILAPIGAHGQQTATAEGGVLTLQEAIHLALSRAPEVALADARIARSSEALRETQAASRPQVVAGTGLAYNNGFPLSIEGAAPSAFQIGVTQSILSKRNNNLIREAAEGVRATKIGSEAARNELAARIALLYYDLHEARRLEALWAPRLEAFRKEQQLTETLLEAGKAKPLDVTLAKTAAAGAEQQVLVVSERARLAETELRTLTGREGGARIQTVDPQMDVQALSLSGEESFRKALESHPEIQQAESNLRAKEFHLEADKGSRYPRLDLVSQYALFTRYNNYQDYFNRFSRNNYIIGMSIQVPLFDGFQTSARVGQSRQDVAEARLRLERTKTDLRLGIERSVSALRIAKGAADLARQELDAAREGLQVSRTLLEGGRLSPKDLFGPQNMEREKEIALSDARKTLFQSQIELLRILGAAPDAR